MTDIFTAEQRKELDRLENELQTMDFSKEFEEMDKEFEELQEDLKSLDFSIDFSSLDFSELGQGLEFDI